MARHRHARLAARGLALHSDAGKNAGAQGGVPRGGRVRRARLRRRAARAARRARQRSVQPLAGVAIAGDAHPGRQRDSDPLWQRRASRRWVPRRTGCDPERRRARAGVHFARLDAAERGRHRARNRTRRRSGRDFRGAIGAPRSRRPTPCRRTRQPVPRTRGRRPLSAGCRRRGPPRAAQHLPRPPRRRENAGRRCARHAAISRRIQHDRSHGRAFNAVALRRAGTSSRAR